ncbi:hypothetical protein IMZ31_22355 (plasmid) [Pontibacillus sp. ALD_SL1]|uniref:hypothetical protein n=1 Tax=Pontibacillus sp. ALD_SL1 TaxID=2777185 RepID=UPI001A96582B|nr:hypothetical protein [Pontibacillus sp. ALD_SL1]QST02198.1 hypothetical protein IMZ31_22355 [Pontibacillus sp. ALD_SL1]
MNIPKIQFDCDCGTTFTVEPPDACYDSKDHINTFTLDCPYCGGETGYTFYITKDTK